MASWVRWEDSAAGAETRRGGRGELRGRRQGVGFAPGALPKAKPAHISVQTWLRSGAGAGAGLQLGPTAVMSCDGRRRGAAARPAAAGDSRAGVRGSAGGAGDRPSACCTSRISRCVWRRWGEKEAACRTHRMGLGGGIAAGGSPVADAPNPCRPPKGPEGQLEKKKSTKQRRCTPACGTTATNRPP